MSNKFSLSAISHSYGSLVSRFPLLSCCLIISDKQRALKVENNVEKCERLNAADVKTLLQFYRAKITKEYNQIYKVKAVYTVYGSGIVSVFVTMAIVDCLVRYWRKCLLEHNSPSNFYVSCWQNSHLSWPLLLLRTFLFLYTFSVLVAAISTEIYVSHMYIYLTYWGFLAILLETGFSTAISAYAHFKRPIDATFGLPWYVKVYWVLYNTAIPVAFLITVFYWCILKSSGKIQKYAPDPVLDVMLHGGNSVVMFIELLCSAHPSRLLHIFQPLFFALAYLLFTVAYYFAGGQDPWGNEFIYPVIDWAKPQQTMVVVALTALFLALMHLVVVAVAAARDAIARRFRNTTGIYNDGFGEE